MYTFVLAQNIVFGQFKKLKTQIGTVSEFCRKKIEFRFFRPAEEFAVPTKLTINPRGEGEKYGLLVK